MAYHLTFWDFYYWGQDRTGSIIPFLAALPVKGVGLDAVDAVTWAAYALLLIGWAGMAILLQNSFLAWVFGVFLLTPPLHFAPLVLAGHPYTGQIFFFGLMATALTRWPARWVPAILVALAAGMFPDRVVATPMRGPFVPGACRIWCWRSETFA
jgi:hypothetical protein